MQKRVIITGSRVQDVGYRLFLLSRASELSGFAAENVGEDKVSVLVEGDESAVNAFAEAVRRERPPLTSVSDISVENYVGKVPKIEDFRAQFSLEQLVKIAITGVEMKGDIKEMKGDIKEMKGDIKEMKGDIKEMKGDIKEMKGDIKEIIAKQDETISEIRSLRSDLKSWMDARFSALEADVRLIKEKLGLI
jgi:acylphosphatase/uncharacterized protein YjbJ (UPF0337 family)